MSRIDGDYVYVFHDVIVSIMQSSGRLMLSRGLPVRLARLMCISSAYFFPILSSGAVSILGFRHFWGALGYRRILRGSLLTESMRKAQSG
jgi:hypothetical protein